jgi:hypothetical protein
MDFGMIITKKLDRDRYLAPQQALLSASIVTHRGDANEACRVIEER